MTAEIRRLLQEVRGITITEDQYAELVAALDILDSAVGEETEKAGGA